MAAVIAALMKLRRSDRLGGRVSLPDRGARPFTYEGTGLMALLSDLGRPKVAPAASPFTSDSRRFSAESQKKGRQSNPKSIWRGCLKDKIKMLRAMTYGDCKIHHRTCRVCICPRGPCAAIWRRQYTWAIQAGTRAILPIFSTAIRSHANLPKGIVALPNVTRTQQLCCNPIA